MGRLGVEFEQVREAAEGLEASGQSPTIERIRQVLGQGSFTTLGRHLKAWRLLRQREGLSREPMPDAITEAAQGLWVGLSEAARTELLQVKAESEAELAQAREKLALQRQQAKSELDAAEHALAESRARAERLEAALETTRIEVQSAQQKHSEERANLRAQLAATSAALQEVHARAQSAERLAHEASKARDAVTEELQRRTKELTEQKEHERAVRQKAGEQIAALQAELTEQKQAALTLRHERDTLKQNVSAAHTETARQKLALQTANERTTQVHGELDKARSQLEAARRTEAALRAQAEQGELRFGLLQKEADELRRTLQEQRDDKHKQLEQLVDGLREQVLLLAKQKPAARN